MVAAAVHPGEVLTNVVSSLPGLLQSLYRVVMFPFCLSPAEGAPLHTAIATHNTPILLIVRYNN